MNVTATIYHDTRRKKNNNTYPVKLRITFKREQRYYPFSAMYDLSIEDYNRVVGDKPRGNFKEILNVLVEERLRAEKIIKKLGNVFNFSLFEEEFKVSEGDSINMFTLLNERAKILRQNGQISTAVSIECTMNSLKKFFTKDELPLNVINVQFLNNYKKWMLDNGKSKTTIGMYARNMRTVFNESIEKKVIQREQYPFANKTNTKGFNIPAGRNIKKALSINDIEAIYNYEPQTESEAKAKSFWLLTYLCNGINMKDIASLKFKNIDGDMIRFVREKTKRSHEDKEPPIISIFLTEDIKRIISEWGNKSVYGGNYIFPILHSNATPEEIYTLVYNAVKTTNNHMKVICGKLGIKENVTTYVARHSFGTILRNSGKSIEFISEQYGHGSTNTTKNYLATHKDDVKKEAADELTNFKKVRSV